LILCVAGSNYPNAGMRLQNKIPFHQGAWAGDHFDLHLYDDLAADMMLDGWVDVTLELANQIFMVWNSERTLRGELDDGS
jgi:hypothetical protein